MTSSSAWKAHERYWARQHGEERSGPRGLGVPDATQTSCPIGLECKCQKVRRLLAADMQQAKENSATSHWALILHTTGSLREDDIIVLPATTYLALLNHELPKPIKETA